MVINEQYKDLSLDYEVMASYFEKDDSEEEEYCIIQEHLMNVYINDVLTMKLDCTPQYLTELVLGRLYTEGMIKSVSDIEYLYVCESGKRARVILKSSASPKQISEEKYVETVSSCCTANHILNDYFLNSQEPEPVQTIGWKPEWIYRLAEKFAEDLPLYNRTGAAHSCFLMIDGQIAFQCEDIGRHNALDKAIGYGLRQNLNLKRGILFTSGRISIDMAMKAIRAGIPILASSRIPTKEAIDLARQCHLVLLGKVKKRNMFCFNNGQKA